MSGWSSSTLHLEPRFLAVPRAAVQHETVAELRRGIFWLQVEIRWKSCWKDKNPKHPQSHFCKVSLLYCCLEVSRVVSK
uniref:Uncharacterized protein n=1 Tax=Anguilla anguilla TaxID=7936 RepID=A0A0E9UII2_ANGAN